MNDHKIIDALRNAPVTARTLDPDQIITRAHRRRVRTWTTSAVAVAGVVATIAAAVGLNVLGRDAADDQVVTPKPSLTTMGTLITIGPLDPAKADELAPACLRQYGRPMDGAKEVVYGMRVRDIDGLRERAAVIVRDRSDDKLYGCFDFEHAGRTFGEGSDLRPDRGRGMPETAAPAGPVVRLTGMGASSSIDVPGTKTQYLRLESWYKVDDSVVRIRQRFLVHRVPTGPWFESDAVNGYVFMRGWLEQPIKKGDPKGINTVGLETYAIDKDGKATKLFGPYDEEFPAEMFPE